MSGLNVTILDSERVALLRTGGLEALPDGDGEIGLIALRRSGGTSGGRSPGPPPRLVFILLPAAAAALPVAHAACPITTDPT
jgi:hypothetical protein